MIATCTMVLACLALHPGVDRGGGDDSQSFLGDGWDGPGLNATTVYFHFRNAHPADGPEQREQMIDVLEDWASVVQIHFIEIPTPGADRCIDFLFATGDHCAEAPAECGAPEACEFNGVGNGRPGHAAFPPGIPTPCGGVSQEPYAGDVHLDADEAYRTSSAENGWSLKLITAHNVGHALGLTDHIGYVMDPNYDWDTNYVPILGTDAAQIQQGYAAGTGSVATLEDLGVWVNSSWSGEERGTPGAPFNTLSEGVGGVPPFGSDVTIHVQAGLYPGPITITKPCIVTSEFGTAFIGQ